MTEVMGSEFCKSLPMWERLQASKAIINEIAKVVYKFMVDHENTPSARYSDELGQRRSSA